MLETVGWVSGVESGRPGCIWLHGVKVWAQVEVGIVGEGVLLDAVGLGRSR
ncbi:hypothetical protein [Nocardia sp. NPDC058114]|uniref:hypothetical protein n=1 Tax=Nocardia sp. NPDC058114 TaxID=3346346 RepID=UPI0036DADCEB